MRKGRFSEEQIINVLKENQAGIPVVELCRKHGISDATFYTWRTKYGGMEVSDARKLKALEDENRKLNVGERIYVLPIGCNRTEQRSVFTKRHDKQGANAAQIDGGARHGSVGYCFATSNKSGTCERGASSTKRLNGSSGRG
jgi:putative transposase